jgi:phosphomannomutase
MKEIAYIFDVDGTLTPSREQIHSHMLEYMYEFAADHEVFLVSGSDYAKTVEQLGEEFMMDSVQLSYNCSGNSVWELGKEIRSSSWKLPGAGRNHLMDLLHTSKCPTKTGNHLEVRPGAVNFSTVGRNATYEQRQEYIEFDKATGERQMIMDSFNTYFGPALNCIATIGGETGIDITQVGYDKRQILSDFDDYTVYFFGDKCQPGGNDYPLAQAISERYNNAEDRVHPVKNWQDTLMKLKILTEPD